jgi:hypothetical protein
MTGVFKMLFWNDSYIEWFIGYGCQHLLTYQTTSYLHDCETSNIRTLIAWNIVPGLCWSRPIPCTTEHLLTISAPLCCMRLWWVSCACYTRVPCLVSVITCIFPVLQCKGWFLTDLLLIDFVWSQVFPFLFILFHTFYTPIYSPFYKDS